MNRTVITMALLVLIGTSTAIAQSTKGTSSPSAGSSMGGGIPQAPIGHRQPRASDVPDEKNLSNPNEPMSKEDALLDKKIKSICRGC